MNRIKIFNSLTRMLRAGLVTLAMGMGAQAHAAVTGTPGNLDGSVRTFVLTARHDFISTADGNSHYAWGYAHGTDFPMQYPGPTLVVNQGDTVKIVLNNALPVPVSMVFPGIEGVTASGGTAGLMTREAPAALPVTANAIVGGPTYTFKADKPGTYMYQSGTNSDLQVEMGLVGTLIVRPTGYVEQQRATWKAYGQAGTEYDREHLFLLTEMDPSVHWQVYTQVFGNQPINIDTTAIHPTIWFINGRTAPDTMLDEYVDWLPTQPYNAFPRMHPGERMLLRVVNAGRDMHPFHTHGNHATPIARDAQVLSSAPGDLTKAPNLTSPNFTLAAIPGQTVDMIYEWTGKNIGWDIYGPTADNPHTCTPDAFGFHSVKTDKNYREWCGDHNKAIPVVVPGQLDVSYGESYSGSPFLGVTGSLPQGHPGLNTTGGYYHMWHSHNEKEITNDNVFPGGMMTMLVVEPWTVSLDTASNSGVTGGDEVVVNQPKADLSITTTNGVTSVARNQALTYTITVTNNGPSPVTGAIVTDSRPTPFTTWTWTCAPATAAGCGTTGNSGTGNINKTLATLASGASVTFTATATVPNSAQLNTNLVNTATVTAPSGITDPNLANNSATDSDPIQLPQADLSITKTNGVTGVVPGQQISYTIVVTNNGPNPVAGALVTDTRPALLTSWNWSCAPATNAGCGTNGNSGSGNISKTLGTLGSGASVTFTVTSTVAGSASGTLSNTASVAAPSGTTDPNTANNSATDTDTVVAPGTATFSPLSAAFGAINNTATITINVTNSATGPLPISSVALVNNTNSRFTIGVNTCTNSTLPASGSCSVEVVFNGAGSTTPRTGTLRITDVNGNHDIPLSGN